MQCSVFNFYIQMVIYNLFTSYNWINVAPPVFLLYNDTPGVAVKEEQRYIVHFPLRNNHLKTD